MNARTVDLDGLEVLVNNDPEGAATGHEPREHPAALWTRQVLVGGRVRAIVRNVDVRTPFDDVHRIAERVGAQLGVGGAEVAFWGPSDTLLPDGASPDADGQPWLALATAPAGLS